jgi:hypothetical protein
MENRNIAIVFLGRLRDKYRLRLLNFKYADCRELTVTRSLFVYREFYYVNETCQKAFLVSSIPS